MKIGSKGLGVILLLAIGLYVVLVLVNLKDEELTPGAAALIKPIENNVPDSQNAFLALIGFDAAVGDNPEQMGRERIKAITDAFNKDSLTESAALPKPENPLVFVGDMEVEVCRIDKGTWTCLEYVRSHKDQIELLVELNRLQLERYRSLAGYRQFQSLFPPSSFIGIPVVGSVGGFTKVRRLVLAEIAHKFLSGQTAAALADMEFDLNLWRGILARADDILIKVIGSLYLDNDYRLLAEMLASGEFVPGAYAAALERLAKPLTKEEKSMDRLQYMAYRQALQSMRQIHSAMRKFRLPATEVYDRTNLRESYPLPTFSRAINLALVPLFQPNATMNRLEARYRSEPVFAGGSRENRDEAKRAFQEKSLSEESVWGWIINPMFEKHLIRAPVEVDLSDYVLRMHDLDAYARLVAFQARALAQKNYSLKLVPEYLVYEETVLRDPKTQAPLKWDPEKKQLWFTAQSLHWQRFYKVDPSDRRLTSVSLP